MLTFRVDYEEASPLLRWLNFNPVMYQFRWWYAERYPYPIYPRVSRADWLRYLKELGCVTPYGFLFWAWQHTVVRNYLRLCRWLYPERYGCPLFKEEE